MPRVAEAVAEGHKALVFSQFTSLLAIVRTQLDAEGIIARDTVEEKVVQLQESKRALADAIVRADEGPIASLRREDLELLLG